MSSGQNVNNMDSFNNDKPCLQQIDRFVAEGVNKVLVGNKSGVIDAFIDGLHRRRT